MQAAVSNIADRHEVVEALKDPKDRCMYGVWGNVLDLLLHHLIPGHTNDSPHLLGHCTALVGALTLHLQNEHLYVEDAVSEMPQSRFQARSGMPLPAVLKPCSTCMLKAYHLEGLARSCRLCCCGRA